MVILMVSLIRLCGLLCCDYVLNFLFFLIVLNKEDVILYDCLFFDDFFVKNYLKNFLSKVFWYFGEWIFYFVFIKGEFVLFDKNMYDLENDMENLNKNDINEKNIEYEKYMFGI